MFHLEQNVWRRIQRPGLSNVYGTDADFALKIRHLTALAFLLAKDVGTRILSIIKKSSDARNRNSFRVVCALLCRRNDEPHYRIK